MAHVYWEKHEIPIPEEAYINHNDGRVYLMDENRKRTVIGHATSESTMHPNDKYRWLYPALWEKYYDSKETKKHELHAGMYGLILGAASQTKVYDIAQEVYGPLYANAIMDYAMFSMMCRTDATHQFSDIMESQVTFSKKEYSDTWYSELFKEKLTDSMHYSFMIKWIEVIKTKNVKKIWLSIDGSNNDCVVEKSKLTEFGNPKSHNQAKTIVSYIYAVSAEEGWPIAYFVNEGSVVDSKAFQKVIIFLKGYGFELEGVILDRGFYSHEVIRTLRELSIDFIIMGQKDTMGYSSILNEKSDTIRWNTEHLVDEAGIFGICEKKQLWASHDDEAYLNLYFDGTGGNLQSVKLIQQVCNAKKDADNACNAGRKPVIDQKYREYFDILEKSAEKYSVSYNYEKWNQSLKSIGYFVIASSKNYSAKKVIDLYRLRNVSELQFKILKTHEGFDTTRVHIDESIRSKFAICFITTILRTAIMLSCKKNRLDTNTMIQKMNRITFLLIENGIYSAVHNCTAEQFLLLNEFDITQDDFTFFANMVNNRNNSSIYNQVHKIPEHKKAEPKKKGRKKGSKNKKTLAKEAENKKQKESGIEPKPKRKPGRPAGSKDKQKRKGRSDAGKTRGKRSTTSE